MLYIWWTVKYELILFCLEEIERVDCKDIGGQKKMRTNLSFPCYEIELTDQCEKSFRRVSPRCIFLVDHWKLVSYLVLWGKV